MQWGVGVIVDATRAALGLPDAAGLRIAFALIMLLHVLSFAWFLHGWRRHVDGHDGRGVAG